MWEKLCRNPLILSILAGAAVFLAFPRFDLFPLILLYPVFTHLLVRNFTSLRQAFLYGFLTSFIIMLGGFYWVIYVLHEFGYLPWGVAVLLYMGFCGFGALNFPLYTTAVHWLRTRLNLDSLRSPWLEIWYSLSLPALFTLIEYAVPKLFPWYTAHCLYRMPWLTQPAELTGSLFLSFSLFSLGSVAGLYLLQKIEGRPRPHPTIWTLPVLLWIFILGFGYYRLSQPPPERTMRVALIQANIGNLEKMAARHGFMEKVRHVVSTYERLTNDALESKPSPDLIVWPETAMPFTLQSESSVYALEIRQKVLGWKVPLITGAYALSPFDLTRDYNSAFLLEPMGDNRIHQEMYHKNVLLAFGEYMPFGEMFPILYRWFPQVSNFERGKIQNAFTLKDGTRLGITICYEVLDPSFFRKVASNEVNAVVNLTNDSWFGPTAEPYLHGALTIFRSIESRLPLIRVTNTGTSFAVDTFGRMSETTGVYQEGVLVTDVRVPATPPMTFYTKHGDWFIVLLLGTELCLLVLFYRRRHATIPV